MPEVPYKLTERDLDLILLEELSSDTGFLAWFVKHLDLVNCTLLYAEHSAWDVDDDEKWGETDVRAFVESDGIRIAILIEDKIEAQFTDRQAERYQERAAKLVERGDADKSLAVLCAPQSYLDGVPADDSWDKRISFEAVLEWFDAFPGFRASWRARVMKSCLERLSASHSAGSEEIRRFSSELRAYLTSLNEGFDHNVTADTWGFIIKSDRTPANVQIAWKNNPSRVDLTFGGDHVGKASGVAVPAGVTFKAADGAGLKSDIFSVKVPVAYMTVPLEEQMDIVSKVMDAIRKLLPLVDAVIGSSD